MRTTLLPDEALPEGNKTKDAIYYGMTRWREMFNPRQQLAHGYCVQAFQECVDTDEDVGTSKTNAERPRGATLPSRMDKMVNRNSLATACGMLEPIKSRKHSATHDFGFKWSYAEMIVGGPAAAYGLQLEPSTTSMTASPKCSP